MAIRVGTQPIIRFYAGPPVLPPWTPADFTDVKYWWTADAGVTESGGNVTAWTDQIQSFVLTGINNPQLTTSATLNGQNVIQTNGTNNYLYSTTTPSSQPVGADLTMLSVINLIDVKTGGAFMGAMYIGPGRRIWVDTLSGNIRLSSEKYPTTLFTSSNLETPAITGAKAIKLRYDSSAGDGYYAIDTLIESTFATGGTTGSRDWVSGATIAIGATLSSTGGGVFSSRYVQVEVAEQVWIENTPTPTEMNNWKTYVNNKYGTIIS
jgi:hypothetical protein